MRMLPRFYMVTDRGKIYRFKSRSAMRDYMKKCGEVLGKTIEEVNRSEFIALKGCVGNDTYWQNSVPFPDMQILKAR